jgi:hypothetical protein
MLESYTDIWTPRLYVYAGTLDRLYWCLKGFSLHWCLSVFLNIILRQFLNKLMIMRYDDTNFYYQIHVYFLLHKLLLSNTCVFLVTQTSIIKYMCISCYSNFYYQIHVYFLLLKLLLQIHVYFLLLKLLLQIHVYFLLNDQHWIQHKLTTRMKPYTYLYNRYCLPLWI